MNNRTIKPGSGDMIGEKVNKPNRYIWCQSSQWDVLPENAFIEYRNIETGISKALCSFILVIGVDLGNGYTRYDPIHKDKVTSEILEAANLKG